MKSPAQKKRIIPARQKKYAVEQVLKSKRDVTGVAKELGVARKTIYTWIKRYKDTPRRNKSKAFKARYVSGKKHPRAVAPKARHRLIRLITSNPEWGCRKLSTELRKAGFELGYFGVNQLLSELGASTPELRCNFARSYSGPGRLEADIKLEIVRKVLEERKSVSQVAKEYGIARKTIYQWLRRYESARQRGLVGASALKETYVSADKHPRAIYPKISEKLLSIVAEKPELSVHRLVKLVPASSWTIWKILDRNNLNLYQQRLAYSQKIAAAQRPILPVRLFDRVKLVWEQFIPSLAPAPPPTFINLLKIFGASSFISFLIFFSLTSWIRLLTSAPSSLSAIGLVFASLALFMGSLFFLYSLKYYLTLAIVLSFSQQEGATSTEASRGKRGLFAWLLGFANGSGRKNGKNGRSGPVGLEPNLEHITLKRKPVISIHIPFYNERNVVKRVIEAATNFDYPEYEIILADDSTDETTKIIRDYQKSIGRPKVKKGDSWTLTSLEVKPGVILKHLHRRTRQGFKGGALREALKQTDKRAEFAVVFDADFVPYPDTLELFLKYFKVQNGMSENYKRSNVAVVQGYQWHVLNKSENWITRGVRSEYAGSYVIERSGGEIYGGLKQISGSVYMIRRDVLEEIGWGTSITEDFQLTLKLYEKGYKVVYTPYIQAPAECVSTLKRLIRQRMRWAEGHSNNVKRMVGPLMLNDKLTLAEKLEFVYLSPYYLQAFFFLIGTISWLISETIFAVRLPFWTSLWGWSLVLTNMLSLPLMNAVGLFLEESEERDYLGLASFVALSYILVPFQAYASLKGFLEKEEGPWFRTPKTGRITDIFKRGTFYRFIAGILPGRTQPEVATERMATSVPVLDLKPNFSFSFRPRRNKFYSRATLSGLLIIVLLLNYLSFFTPSIILAAAPDPTIEQQINIIDQEYSSSSTSSAPTDNSLGLIRWDSAEYTGDTVYFEAVIKNNNAVADLGTYTSIDCPAADDCKIVYYDTDNGSLNFIDCDDATCSTGTTTILDGDTGCSLTGCSTTDNIGQFYSSIDCPAADNCKISYRDVTNSDLYFADCANATCSSGTRTLVDGAGTGSYSSIDCPASDNCKISYRGTNTSLRFADCGDETCSSGNATVRILDGDTGCVLSPSCSTSDDVGAFTSIDCPASDNCKISYRDVTNTALKFADCGDETCSSGSVTTVDGAASDVGEGSSIYCPTASDCKISYRDIGNTDLKFADCNDATCSSPTINVLDGDATICTLTNCVTGAVGAYTSIDCSAGATDCKISYRGGALKFADCGDGACSSGTVTIPDGATGCTLTNCSTSDDVGTYTSIDCPTATNCKVSYYDVTNADLKFADCDDATCSSGTANIPDTGGQVTAGLYDSSGTLVTNSEVSSERGSYIRKRSSALTQGTLPSLESAKDYTVRVKGDTANTTAFVQAARLIIVQTDPTAIYNTMTQIELGDNQSTTATSVSPDSLTTPKYYKYDDTKFSGTRPAYFEATLKATTITATTTYYLSGFDSGTAWTNSPANMVDGSTSNFAVTGGNDETQLNNSNTCDATCGSQSETITKVELRIHACQDNKDNGTLTLTPVFSGSSDGDGHTWSTVPDGTSCETTVATWSSYYDITTDTNAPSPWGWSDVQNLDVRVFADRVGGADIIHASKVDIRVTYETGSTSTAYAELFNRTDGVAVTNGTVSVNSASWTRVRGASALSTNWDTANADEYEVRIYSSSSSYTAYIANAKIIIDQSDTGGLTDIEIIHHYNSTKVDVQASGGTTAYAQLTISGGGAAISGSKLSTTSTSYQRLTSSGLTLSTNNLDVELSADDSTYVEQGFDNKYDSNNWAAGTFTYLFEVDLAYSELSGNGFSHNPNSWLIIQVSNLQIPENLLLFLPLMLLLPKIFSKRGFVFARVNLGLFNPIKIERKRKKGMVHASLVEVIDDG